MDIKPRGKLMKAGDLTAIRIVDVENSAFPRIISDPSSFRFNNRHGEDVGNPFWIVIHCPKTWKISFQSAIYLSTVGVNPNGTVCSPDVLEI